MKSAARNFPLSITVAATSGAYLADSHIRIADAQGKLVLRTIRPAGYPHSELPAHVHLGLTVQGRGVPVGEVRFDDDPRLTPEIRKQSLQEGDVIVRPEVQPDGSQRCRAEFRVRVPSRGSESRSAPSPSARG